MKNHIKNITIGIRFVRTFHLPEIAGKITDDILRSSKSPFDEKFFEFVERDREGGRILHRGEVDNTKLIINKDDIIFSLDTENFDEDYKKIKDTYLPYITDHVVSGNNLNRIQRLGVIFRHAFENSSFSDNTVKSITDNKINSPNDLITRFSKKIGTMGGKRLKESMTIEM